MGDVHHCSTVSEMTYTVSSGTDVKLYYTNTVFETVITNSMV